jgi:hypothetical protein
MRRTLGAGLVGAGLLGSLLALALGGCVKDAGASDHRRSTCTVDERARRGACTRTLVSLESSLHRDEISSRIIKQAADVRLEVTARVSKGAARVWFEELDGTRREAVVRPGEVASLAGRPRTSGLSDARVFVLFYEPLEGRPPRAEGLEVSLTYQVGD